MIDQPHAARIAHRLARLRHRPDSLVSCLEGLAYSSGVVQNMATTSPTVSVAST